MATAHKLHDVDEDPFDLPGPPAIYDVDPDHSSARFHVRHLVVASIHGQLGTVTGRIELDEEDIKLSLIEAAIDVTAITTQHAVRDAHLCGPDFLDVANFPTIAFRSERIEEMPDDKLLVVGELSIRGTPQLVALSVTISDEVRDPWGNTRRAATVTTRINRKDFGVSPPASATGWVLTIGDMVDIEIDVQLVRKRE